MSKCKCKLAVVVLEVAEGCPFHKEVTWLVKECQPLALNCTICGSTTHSDSCHSERCPQVYR